MHSNIIKENGKIVGYKTYLYSILNDEDIKKRKLARVKQQDELRRADDALERWARWTLSSHGYNRVSSIVNVDYMSKGFEWKIPNGVEMNQEVGNVIYIFDVMRKGGRHMHVNLLQFFYLIRSNNQSVKGFFDDFDVKNQRIKFIEARKEFAQRIAVLS